MGPYMTERSADLVEKKKKRELPLRLTAEEFARFDAIADEHRKQLSKQGVLHGLLLDWMDRAERGDISLPGQKTAGDSQAEGSKAKNASVDKAEIRYVYAETGVISKEEVGPVEQLMTIIRSGNQAAIRAVSENLNVFEAFCKLTHGSKLHFFNSNRHLRLKVLQNWEDHVAQLDEGFRREFADLVNEALAPVELTVVALSRTDDGKLLLEVERKPKSKKRWRLFT